MAVVIDTPVFLWFLRDDPQLSETAVRLLEDSREKKILSLASVWEMADKVRQGRLRLGMDFEAFLNQFVNNRELDLLDIRLPHLAALATLPAHHPDPYDRLLIAQAQVERLPVVSANERLDDYGIERRW